MKLLPLPAQLGQQNILSPAGPAAHNLANLGWFVLLLSLGVLVVMWGLIAMILTRKRGNLIEHAPADLGGGQKWVMFGGFLFPTVVLAAMYFASLGSMASFPLNRGMDRPPQIQIIGHQWWWEVHYLYGPLHDHFVTANEIHIPAGETVDIDLLSQDVIHSFWVPALHGKVDMIPGMTNRIRVEADHPGILRGQCAVYCGDEHPKMVLLVVVQSPSDFQKWLANARSPAVQPATPWLAAGQQVFLSSSCALCHTIDGTLAHGSVGPDLTHLGSRRMIAANWLENNNGNLEAWVTYARSLKPGVIMPNVTSLTGDQVRELVAYLQSLK